MQQPTKTPTTSSKLTRRTVLAGLASLAAAPLILPRPAFALSTSQAEQLVNTVVAEINRIIASGQSQSAMIADFEKLFARYADVNIIAQSCLGPAARSYSPAQLAAYTKAFQGYIARKYGKRFREFIGGEVIVKGARPVKTWIEVDATANLKGQAPFDVKFLVSDRSGKPLFFDLFIEGISMRISEREEIGAMLDANRGDIAALTAALQKAG